MRSGVTTAYYALALLIAAGMVVQVFLGRARHLRRGELRGPQGLRLDHPHRRDPPVPLALLGPRTGRAIGLSFGLLVLMTIQIMLVNARDDAPYVAALHPVFALLVLGLAVHIGMPLVTSRRRAASAPR